MVTSSCSCIYLFLQEWLCCCPETRPYQDSCTKMAARALPLSFQLHRYHNQTRTSNKNRTEPEPAISASGIDPPDFPLLVINVIVMSSSASSTWHLADIVFTAAESSQKINIIPETSFTFIDTMSVAIIYASQLFSLLFIGQSQRSQVVPRSSSKAFEFDNRS